MKPKQLYHGSPKGNIKIFKPKKPADLGKCKDNKHEGVYVTSNKKWIMVMGVLAKIKKLSDEEN